MASEVVDAGGAQLAVTRWGGGQPVVGLHAIGHSAADFAPFAQRIGPGFEVVAPDWPGQGDSPLDGGPVTAAHYADLLEAALPKLCKGPAILIGNSIGGAAAITLAARRPEAVKALVICNSGGLARVGPVERTAIGVLSSFFRAGARGAGWFKPAFAAYYGMVLPRAPERRQQIIAAAYDVAPLLAEAWAGFARPEADLRALASKIAAPTLFAWTKGDQLIPWSKSRTAAERFPHHRVRFFRGGHAAFLEDTDAFAEAFREGVQTLETTKAA